MSPRKVTVEQDDAPDARAADSTWTQVPSTLEMNEAAPTKHRASNATRPKKMRTQVAVKLVAWGLD